ncbi:MAG: cysteine hydrolase [Gammaproteobacteria bacterium]|nr:cysteine hydrolase [Gammaproteobacteria bacterium]
MQPTSWTKPEFGHAALVTIDVQRDTLDGQPFEITGTSKALPHIKRLCDAFRSKGAPIVHILRLYLPDGSNAELCRREALSEGAQMFLVGSEGRELAPELLPHHAAPPDDNLLLTSQPQEIGEKEWYIYKSRWGAFYNSCLEETLRAHDVSTIVLAGCNYPNCIRATVYEASERDFRVVAITDGISNFSENGWNELSSIGINLMSADNLINGLNGK